ncbi:MAG: acetoin utilization protein AcuC, partial [Miltoncostaeaceae bacterium]
MTVTIPWSPRLQAYNPSDDGERALRRGLAWDLLAQMGLLDAVGVSVLDPPGMDDAGLARVHAPAYIQAVRR